MEHAGELAKASKGRNFVQHAVDTFPEKGKKGVLKVRNHDWNAIKHSRDLKGNLRRPEVDLDGFTDDQNDHRLFITWYNFCLAEQPLPIEAQVFQDWYISMYPDNFVPDASVTGAFEGIAKLTRPKQKERLRKAIAHFSTLAELMSASTTDPRGLILP